jgi:cell pole-organizing protein PopZ
MDKAQAIKQPSIEDLLTSIRQAIHERVEPGGPAQACSPSLVHTRPTSGPEIGASDAATVTLLEQAPKIDEAPTAGSGAEDARTKPTIVTTDPERFAGLLGGDVRLEEALARLNQTGGRRGTEAPRAAAQNAAAADAAAPAEPKLRPTVHEWTGQLAKPTPVAPTRVSPLPTRLAPVRPATVSAVANQPIASASSPASAGWRRDDANPPWARQGEPARDPDVAGAHKHAVPDRKNEFPEEDPLDAEHRGTSGAAERPARASASDRPGDLLSSEAASSAISEFNRLADAVVSRSPRGERALDEITRDCLRPLVKVWLDENLPGLVERLVRQEIERVARTGR